MFDIPDWQIRRLVETAWYLRCKRMESIRLSETDTTGKVQYDGDIYPQFLHLWGLIKEFRKQQRQRRATTDYIMSVYANSVLANLKSREESGTPK